MSGRFIFLDLQIHWGIDVKSEADQFPFHPYYTVKDAFGIGVFLIIFCAFVFYMPEALGHTDNNIKANPLATPPSIVPEWYFLPFYAILRAVDFPLAIPFTDIVLIKPKLLGVLAMFGAIIVLFFLPWLDGSKIRSGQFRPAFKIFFGLLVIDTIILTWVGGKPAEAPYTYIAKGATAYYFIHFLIVLPMLARMEKPLPLPESIGRPVLGNTSAQPAE